MMGRHIASFGNLTIPNNETTSNVLATKSGFSGLVDLTIFAPATLTAAVTVQVAPVDNPAGGDWRPLQSGGADVTTPANKATVIAGAFKALRLVSAGAEGAERVFRVLGQIATSD